MPGDVVLLELVLHEAAGDPQHFCRVGLNEVGTHEGTLDEGSLDTVESVS